MFFIFYTNLYSGSQIELFFFYHLSFCSLPLFMEEKKKDKGQGKNIVCRSTGVTKVEVCDLPYIWSVAVQYHSSKF